MLGTILPDLTIWKSWVQFIMSSLNLFGLFQLLLCSCSLSCKGLTKFVRPTKNSRDPETSPMKNIGYQRKFIWSKPWITHVSRRVLHPQVGLTTLSFLHQCILIFMGLDVDLPFPVKFPERLIGIEISILQFYCRIILDTISVEYLPTKTTCLTVTTKNSPKINTEPKNHPLEKENHLPSLPLLCSMLIFQGVPFLTRILSGNLLGLLTTSCKSLPMSCFLKVPSILPIYPIIHKGFYTSQVVVGDFETINSSAILYNTLISSLCTEVPGSFYGRPNDIAKYVAEYTYYVYIYDGSIVQVFQWNYILLDLIFRAVLRQRLHSLQLKLQQLILLGQGLLLCEKSDALRGFWCNYLYLHGWFQGIQCL